MVGCTQTLRTEQANTGERVDIDTFLHEHLQQTPAVTTAEAYRAMLILADGEDTADGFEAREQALFDRGIARPQWKLQHDQCIDRGAIAFMVTRVLAFDASVNRNVLGATGVGDRRYANRDLIAADMLRDSPDYAYMTGSELVHLMASADAWMAEHGRYEATTVDLVEELRAVSMGGVVQPIETFELAGQSPQTQPAKAAATQPTGDPGSARVLRTTGRVSVSIPDAQGNFGAWREARADDLLPQGTRIRTRTRAHVLLQFGDDTIVVIERATLASIDQFVKSTDTAAIQLGLGHGSIRGGVSERTLRSDLTIDTPTATLSKRGTIDFRIEYEPSYGRFRISLAEQGLVEALNRILNQSRDVLPGQYVTQLMARWIDTAMFDRFIPMISTVGQTSAESWFNVLSHSGFIITLPGAGAEGWSFVGRRGGELAGMPPQPQQDMRRSRFDFSFDDGVRNRPEGNFGTGGARTPNLGQGN